VASAPEPIVEDSFANASEPQQQEPSYEEMSFDDVSEAEDLARLTMSSPSDSDFSDHNDDSDLDLSSNEEVQEAPNSVIEGASFASSIDDNDDELDFGSDENEERPPMEE